MSCYSLPETYNGVRLSTKAMRQAQVDAILAVNAAEIAKAVEHETAWKYASGQTYSNDDIQRNHAGWIRERERLLSFRAEILAAHATRELLELCRKQGKRSRR